MAGSSKSRGKDEPANEFGLTPKQQRFVDEYLIDLNGKQAAIRAGYSEATAEQQASRLLRNVKVAFCIKEAQRKLAQDTKITQEMVLKRWWEIANADPNDLIQYRRTCCRHCHGKKHGYQWIDEAEYERAVAASLADAKEDEKPRLPSNAGGYGFNANADPHPDCPACNGDGHGHVFAQDTRNLTGGARLLYDGVKQTKEGLEIKLLDRGKALENVARHLGMFNDKLTLKGDPESPITLLLQQIGGSSLPVVRETDGE